MANGQRMINEKGGAYKFGKMEGSTRGGGNRIRDRVKGDVSTLTGMSIKVSGRMIWLMDREHMNITMDVST